MLNKDYYRRVKTAILYSNEYGNLIGKSELGKDVSQYATVDLASTLSECMAEELGYDSQKASVLAMSKGIVFPPYGKAGMNYIKILAKRENIDINEMQICKSVVEKILTDNKIEIDKDLEEGIEDLFSDTPKENESGIVRNVYGILNDIDILKENSSSMQAKLSNKTFDILRDSIAETKRTGKISTSPKLQQLKQMEAFEQESGQLSEEQKEILDQLWQNYKTYGDPSQEVVKKVITEQER